jgi:hypothetical protein
LIRGSDELSPQIGLYLVLGFMTMHAPFWGNNKSRPLFPHESHSTPTCALGPRFLHRTTFQLHRHTCFRRPVFFRDQGSLAVFIQQRERKSMSQYAYSGTSGIFNHGRRAEKKPDLKTHTHSQNGALRPLIEFPHRLRGACSVRYPSYILQMRYIQTIAYQIYTFGAAPVRRGIRNAASSARSSSE